MTDPDTVLAAANQWATQLRAAGLTPHDPFAFRFTTSEWDVVVQVATSDRINDVRAELLPAIGEAVEETVCRVLGFKPVR